MDKQMEKIIAKDLKMPIGQIRNLPWNKLEKRNYGIKERAFRPQEMFIIGGNINLSLGRVMGLTRIAIHENMRKVNYRIKCLLKNKRKG